MQVLKKIVPYKVRRALPILGIAMGGMFMSSCSNDEPDVPMHDTTYTWTPHNFRDTELKNKIRASADSASVRYIILKSSGEDWRGGCDEKDLRYQLVEPLIQAGGEQNRHKFKGAGTIPGVYVTYPEDNKWLTDFGYNIISYQSMHQAEQNQR